MKRILEICTQNIQSVIAAQKAGADRIELCSGLELGGLTPSYAFTEMALERFEGKVLVLLRPRPGHFIYSKDEIELLVREAKMMADCGVHGIVFGALDQAGNVDIDVCSRLRDAAPDLDFTFHRAIDVCRNPEEGIEVLIESGIKWVLTSGGAIVAIDALPRLTDWQKNYGDQINLLIGGGVRSSNLARLMQTGAREYHLSAQELLFSALEGELIPGGYRSSSFEEITACREILQA